MKVIPWLGMDFQFIKWLTVHCTLQPVPVSEPALAFLLKYFLVLLITYCGQSGWCNYVPVGMRCFWTIYFLSSSTDDAGSVTNWHARGGSQLRRNLSGFTLKASAIINVILVWNQSLNDHFMVLYSLNCYMNKNARFGSFTIYLWSFYYYSLL